MNNVSSLNIFLTNYICSLYERTRSERSGSKIGFDWIIYKLALVQDWLPVRLPFYRNVTDGKTKTEPEFGIDMSFLAPSKKELRIFILKNEPLTYSNWIKHDFDKDIRLASSPDLRALELSNLEKVTIIIVYNKDDDTTGIAAFENLIRTLPATINNNISLKFERWNLTKLVEEIKHYLITPDLLPQYLSEHFRYICSQIKDFNFGSDQWENQLVPNWNSFLNILLSEYDERKILLIPVILSIAYNYRKDTSDSYPGWIDLIEWAMLALWRCYKNDLNGVQKKINKVIAEIWISFYIIELEKYFLNIENVLTTQHAFSAKRTGSGFGVSPINDAYLAYWHIGRLGILTLAPQDFQINAKNNVENTQIATVFQLSIKRSADWLVRCLNINPAALRPLLDLNHIELFLIWAILLQAGRKKDIYEWLSELEGRLLMRRAKMNIPIPFIEANSRMDLVAEYAATGKKPYNFSDNSSYLLLMILELCFSLPDAERDELLNRYMKRIVKGIDENNHTFAQDEIDLLSWVPPEDWFGSILEKSVWDGIAITTGNFERIGEKALPLSESIKQFVEETRKKYPWKMPEKTPLAVYILACIKHRSPLPPEFWRGTIFPMEQFDKEI